MSAGGLGAYPGQVYEVVESARLKVKLVGCGGGGGGNYPEFNLRPGDTITIKVKSWGGGGGNADRNSVGGPGSSGILGK